MRSTEHGQGGGARIDGEERIMDAGPEPVVRGLVLEVAFASLREPQDGAVHDHRRVGARR
jgi:hypothetical protein